MRSRQLHLRRPDGTCLGPLAEQEVLDLLAEKEISDDWQARLDESAPWQAVTDFFERIRPDELASEKGEEIGDFEDLAAKARDSFFPDLARADDSPKNPSKPILRDDEENDEEQEETTAAPVRRVLRPARKTADLTGEPLPDDIRQAVLMGEEVELYRGFPSLWYYWKSLAMALVLLASAGPVGAQGGWWVMGSIAGAIFFLVRVLIQRGAIEYLITTHRVEITQGLVKKHTRFLPWKAIDRVHYQANPWARLCRVGQVYFFPIDKENFPLIFKGLKKAKPLSADVKVWQDQLDSWR